MIFGQQNPSLMKILASRVVLTGTFAHLGKIWDTQIGSCCKLALTNGEHARKWAWFRQSGRGFEVFARIWTGGTPLLEILDPPLINMIQLHLLLFFSQLVSWILACTLSCNFRSSVRFILLLYFATCILYSVMNSKKLNLLGTWSRFMILNCVGLHYRNSWNDADINSTV